MACGLWLVAGLWLAIVCGREKVTVAAKFLWSSNLLSVFRHRKEGGKRAPPYFSLFTESKYKTKLAQHGFELLSLSAFQNCAHHFQGPLFAENKYRGEGDHRLSLECSLLHCSCSYLQLLHFLLSQYDRRR